MKKRTIRNILSITLSAVLAIGMSVTSFAEELPNASETAIEENFATEVVEEDIDTLTSRMTYEDYAKTYAVLLNEDGTPVEYPGLVYTESAELVIHEYAGVIYTHSCNYWHCEDHGGCAREVYLFPEYADVEDVRAQFHCAMWPDGAEDWTGDGYPDASMEKLWQFFPAVNITEENFPNKELRDWLKYQKFLDEDDYYYGYYTAALNIWQLMEVEKISVRAEEGESLEYLKYFPNLKEIGFSLTNLKEITFDCNDFEQMGAKWDKDRNGFSSTGRILFTDNTTCERFEITLNDRITEVMFTGNKNADIIVHGGESSVEDFRLTESKTSGTLDLSNYTKLKIVNINDTNISNLILPELEYQSIRFKNCGLSHINLPGIPYKNFDTSGNVYQHNGASIDLATLAGFDVTKMSGVTGGTLNGTILTPAEELGTVSYTYEMYPEVTEVFSIKFNDTEYVPPKFVPVKSVAFDSKIETLQVGETYQLSYTILPEDATNKKCYVYATNSVATVDENGLLTANKVGSTEIEVYSEELGIVYSDSFFVTVVPVPVGSVSLSKTSASVFEGESFALIAKVAPENAGNKNVAWASSDESIATVDSTGKVTAVSAGEVTITAVSQDNAEITAQCTVTVNERPADKVLVSEKFTDVKAGEWYTPFVQFVFDSGYMSGKSENWFDTFGKLTRAEFATILYNVAGAQEVVENGSTFSDIAAEWYRKPILWASQNGIASGYPNGKFGVNDPITREQLALMLYKYSGETVSEEATLEGFNDVSDISGYALEAVTWAVERGIMSGTPEGNLNPKGNTTRAEAATMISNFAQRND